MRLSAPVASIDGVVIESELAVYYKLAHAIACRISKLYGQAHLKDDFTQIAIMAFMGCLDRYDANQDCSLINYARSRMWGAIVDKMRNGIRYRGKCETYFFNSIDNIEYKNLGYSTDYPLQYDLDHLVFPDSDRARSIVIDSILEGNDIIVGKRFGISGSRVCQYKALFRKANITLLS